MKKYWLESGKLEMKKYCGILGDSRYCELSLRWIQCQSEAQIRSENPSWEESDNGNVKRSEFAAFVICRCSRGSRTQKHLGCHLRLHQETIMAVSRLRNFLEGSAAFRRNFLREVWIVLVRERRFRGKSERLIRVNTKSESFPWVEAGIIFRCCWRRNLRQKGCSVVDAFCG